MEKIIICLGINNSASSVLDYGLKFAEHFNLRTEVMLIRRLVDGDNIDVLLEGIPPFMPGEKTPIRISDDHDEEIINKLRQMVSSETELTIMDYSSELLGVLEEKYKLHEFSTLLLPHSPKLENWPFMDSLSKFVETLNCPVLLVDPLTIFKKPEHVVYASNYLHSDVNVLKRFKKISANKVKDIDIIHISYGDTFKEKILGKGFQAYLEENVSDLNIKVHQISAVKSQSTTIEVFLEEVAKISPDMLILMKEEKSFLEVLFSKSFTIATAKKCSIPLLILHQ
ncbi:MAG: hypothetical protein ACRCX5_05460, partial [Bacteroidales bacterium]